MFGGFIFKKHLSTLMFGVHGSICVTLFVSIVLAIHLILHDKNVKSKLMNYFDLKVHHCRED